MKTGRRQQLSLVALVATTAVTLAACGSGTTASTGASGEGDTTGVTDTSVLVGTHMPLTGPAAAGYSKIPPATQAYFDYINEQGGVNGRTIEYKALDDGYNPSNTQQVVRELVLQDRVFAILGGLGTPTHSGVLDFLDTNNVPDLFVASGSRIWNQPDKYPNTFGFNADYTVEAKIMAQYVKDNLPGKKVCTLGQDDDLGGDYLAGVEQIVGADAVVEKQFYATSNTNVAPQIGALQAAGCEVVMLATIPGFTALAIGTAGRLGFRPQWTTASVGGDYLTLSKTLGDAAPLAEGLLSTNYLPSHFSEDDEWTTKFREINTKYNNGAEFDGNVVYGMSMAHTFVQALEAAGENPTRESIVEAIRSSDFTGPNLVPFRFAEDDHSGAGGARVNQVTNGVQEYFGPAYTTTDALGDPVVEYRAE
ncbi:ABC transporter substrate-binding protein [Rhodococcus sp. NPDC058639]|uniref:ABC transporter substrate-binding protein n=1 Tax=Rhodococcus sp. NPDC058639 TaxID=3346570 RepID=UPI0036668334